MSNLTVDDYNKGIGAIIMNLQALESIIRFFFFRRNGEKNPFPKPKESEVVPNSSLVTHQQLKKWIRKYNGCLSKEEVTKYSISEDIIEVRDALAHGRLVAPDPPELPYTLWNFGQPSNGQVEIRFCEVLTAEWLEQTKVAIYDAKEKVSACFNSRGYKGLS
jgi:hypothetical protein